MHPLSPFSVNVPLCSLYFIILLCTTPDDFTRQRKSAAMDIMICPYIPTLCGIVVSRCSVIKRDKQRLRWREFLGQERQVRCVNVRGDHNDGSLDDTTADHHTEVTDIRTERARFGKLLNLKLSFRVRQVQPFFVRLKIARHFFGEQLPESVCILFHTLIQTYTWKPEQFKFFDISLMVGHGKRYLLSNSSHLALNETSWDEN